MGFVFTSKKLLKIIVDRYLVSTLSVPTVYILRMSNTFVNTPKLISMKSTMQQTRTNHGIGILFLCNLATVAEKRVLPTITFTMTNFGDSHYLQFVAESFVTLQ